MDDDLYDAVVVGGGAAGLSAGLVLAQAQCRVAVVDAGEPRNRYEAHMHGYLSRDGMAPTELLSIGRREVRDAGGEILDDRVVGASVDGDEQTPRFTLETEGGTTLRTRRVVVATGLHDEMPDVDGLGLYWGHAVFHCPYCHGVEITDDLVVGVLASTRASVLKAHLLLQWAKRVVLLTHDRPEPPADDLAGLAARGIEVVPGRVVAVEGDGEQLTAVVHADGSRTTVDELLISPTSHLHREVLDLLGVDVRDKADKNGIILRTDDSGLTSVPGVYAAGNVRDTNAQVVDAAAQGLKTAIAVNASLIEERVREALQAKG